MSFKLTKVNSLPGENITVVTDDIPEPLNPTNRWYTNARVVADVESNRTSNPTYQDKHFYTTGLVAPKTGDLYWQILSPIEIEQVQLYVKTAPTGTNLGIQVTLNEGSLVSDNLFSLQLQPGDTLIQSTTAPKTVNSGDYIRIDVLQVGQTTPGSDMIVSFKYRSII